MIIDSQTIARVVASSRPVRSWNTSEVLAFQDTFERDGELRCSFCSRRCGDRNGQCGVWRAHLEQCKERWTLEELRRESVWRRYVTLPSGRRAHVERQKRSRGVRPMPTFTVWPLKRFKDCTQEGWWDEDSRGIVDGEVLSRLRGAHLDEGDHAALIAETVEWVAEVREEAFDREHGLVKTGKCLACGLGGKLTEKRWCLHCTQRQTSLTADPVAEAKRLRAIVGDFSALIRNPTTTIEDARAYVQRMEKVL